jgi:hypothetical protein
MSLENTADLFTFITCIAGLVLLLSNWFNLQWLIITGISGIIAANLAFLFTSDQYAPQVEIGVSISTIILLIGIWRQSWHVNELKQRKSEDHNEASQSVNMHR